MSKKRAFPKVDRDTQAIVAGHEALCCFGGEALMEARRCIAAALTVRCNCSHERRGVVPTALPFVHHLPCYWVLFVLGQCSTSTASDARQQVLHCTAKFTQQSRCCL